MLKSCKYCMRIHDSKFDCGKKPVRKKQYNTKNSFRSTHAWTKKSNEIRDRDNNLCQICIRKLYKTINQYTYDNLEVHHAIALEDDFDKRLDDDILITLCKMHHELAESGEIPLIEVLSIISVQNSKYLQ